MTLINLAQPSPLQVATTTQSAAGTECLKSALEQPFRILLANAGLNADEWLPQVKAAKPGRASMLTMPTKLVDLKAAGIVDPARVTKEAIQNAVSIAGTGMTMGALVVDVPEPKSAAAAALVWAAWAWATDVKLQVIV